VRGRCQYGEVTFSVTGEAPRIIHEELGVRGCLLDGHRE
jgi:hypothetical protein